MGRPVVSEKDVIDAVKRGQKSLSVLAHTIITDAAQEYAKKHNVSFPIQSTFENQQAEVPSKTKSEEFKQNPAGNSMLIAIGSDHGGYTMKGTLKSFLCDEGYKIIDVGTDSEKTCDYPDFSYAVASLVSSGKADRGIVIDGVGVASSIVANKVPGVRSVPCFDEFTARSSREHNNANVLTLGGRILGIELMKSIVGIWLNTPFSGGRHISRVEKINDIEKRFLKSS